MTGKDDILISTQDDLPGSDWRLSPGQLFPQWGLGSVRGDRTPHGLAPSAQKSHVLKVRPAPGSWHSCPLFVFPLCLWQSLPLLASTTPVTSGHASAQTAVPVASHPPASPVAWGGLEALADADKK